MDKVLIIGYSGHAYVCIDAALSSKVKVLGYFENKLKSKNPYQLKYLGSEIDYDFSKLDKELKIFVSMGSNELRSKIFKNIPVGRRINVIHQNSIVSPTVKLGQGILISGGAIVNSLAEINNGVILNTGCIVEHECKIGEFSHIAPGAVLAGNVEVGSCTMIGANAVEKQGVTIGNNVMVGAGAVVIRNVEDGTVVAGNPAVNLKIK